MIWLISVDEITVLVNDEEAKSIAFDCTGLSEAISYSEGVYCSLIFITGNSLVKLTLNEKRKRFH